MRVGAAIGLLLATGLLARAAVATETSESGAATGPDAAVALVDAGAGDATPASLAGPSSQAATAAAPAAAAPPPAAGAPAAAPPAHPVAHAPDPVRVAAEEAQRVRDRWPLAYVDRPQTLLANMEEFSLATRDLFGGPTGYRRFLLGIAYAKAPADWVQVFFGLPWLYCSGEGLGACSSTFEPNLGASAALVRGERARLALGASVFDLWYSATAWTRLKLVVPGRFSFEIEPSVVLGFEHATMPAWWDSTVLQNGNQSRAYLTFDANLQVTEQVLLWADAIPYAPTAGLGGSLDAALEIAGGASLSFTKTFELSVACRAFNVLAARRWEYAPDVRSCGLTFVARGFGPGPSGYVLVPETQNLY
jgi:hypothetical protein